MKRKLYIELLEERILLSVCLTNQYEGGVTMSTLAGEYLEAPLCQPTVVDRAVQALAAERESQSARAVDAFMTRFTGLKERLLGASDYLSERAFERILAWTDGYLAASADW